MQKRTIKWLKLIASIVYEWGTLRKTFCDKLKQKKLMCFDGDDGIIHIRWTLTIAETQWRHCAGCFPEFISTINTSWRQVEKSKFIRKSLEKKTWVQGFPTRLWTEMYPYVPLKKTSNYGYRWLFKLFSLLPNTPQMVNTVIYFYY